MIKSSVDLQWTRPSYTGGVDVVNYKISSTNGTTVTVEDSSEVVQYSPGLVYGDVQVSAINTCDLESQPAVINIPAAGDYIAIAIATSLANMWWVTVGMVSSNARRDS